MAQEKHNTSARWNDIWGAGADAISEPDEMLATQVRGLSPGRALEMGCGVGGNAVWLTEHGWQVTAVDFAEAAIVKGRQLAEERGVTVDFVVADAAAYQPRGQYDLITVFYIQLPVEERARMLSTAANALAPGGTLLFVSHDRSSPPSGWDEEDLLTLTTPNEIVSELPGLKIEQAIVFDHGETGANPSHAHGSHADHDAHEHSTNDAHHSQSSKSTVVRAVRPA